MNSFKKVLCLVFAAALVLALASCGRVPTEEVTTATQAQTAVNPLGSKSAEEGQTVIKATESDIVFIYQNYNKYGDNYASIQNIQVDNERYSVNLNGTVDLKIIRIGSRSDGMRIAVKAYDANGEVVRDSYLECSFKGTLAGGTVEGVRFTVPHSAVKVEFADYAVAAD